VAFIGLGISLWRDERGAMGDDTASVRVKYTTVTISR
jgi:hypothetical protein